MNNQQTKLKNYLQIKRFPELFHLNNSEQQAKINTEFDRMLKEITDTIENMFAEFLQSEMKRQLYFNVKLEEMNEIVIKLKDDIQGKVEKIENLVKSGRLKGDKGESGKDGVGKDGRDGKTPSYSELKEIIKPLIPKPIKGDKGDSIIGPAGKDGKDASIPNLDELAEKIDITKIKGLRKLLSGIKKGGGMGNVITEIPTGSVDGSNDTFTLSYVPKTNSLILLWQGQFQRAGYEYTLSDKTITFAGGSIPTAGSLFAWYIR